MQSGRILITGASGFIGGFIGSALKVKNTVLQFVLDVVGACILIAILNAIF